MIKELEVTLNDKLLSENCDYTIKKGGIVFKFSLGGHSIVKVYGPRDYFQVLKPGRIISKGTFLSVPGIDTLSMKDAKKETTGVVIPLHRIESLAKAKKREKKPSSTGKKPSSLEFIPRVQPKLGPKGDNIVVYLDYKHVINT